MISNAAMKFDDSAVDLVNLSKSTIFIIIRIQIVFIGNQLIMNNTHCPTCNQIYTFSNPPKKLKNCSHSICDSCLPTSQSKIED